MGLTNKIILAISLIVEILLIATSHSSYQQQAGAQLVSKQPIMGGGSQTINPLSSSPPDNTTSSISIFPILMQALKTHIHTNVNDAATIAMKNVGPNSSVLASSLHSDRGFLDYRVFVMGANNTVYMVSVDPGNGKVLLTQQIPSGLVNSIIVGSSTDGASAVGISRVPPY